LGERLSEEEGNGEGKGRGAGGEEGREREGPKLLLNQGPSELCYATAMDRVEIDAYDFNMT